MKWFLQIKTQSNGTFLPHANSISFSLFSAKVGSFQYIETFHQHFCNKHTTHFIRILGNTIEKKRIFNIIRIVWTSDKLLYLFAWWILIAIKAGKLIFFLCFFIIQIIKKKIVIFRRKKTLLCRFLLEWDVGPSNKSILSLENNF